MHIENITQEFLNLIKTPAPDCKKLNYLIVMPCQTDMRSQYVFPVGLGIVSSALKVSGRCVYTLNLTYKKSPDELLRKIIIEKDINVVATGGLSGEYRLIRNIIDIAKNLNPNIITIVGGGIITAEPEVAMKALEVADYGVFGEGEITICDLAYALETNADTSSISGVICMDLKSGPNRTEIPDLDILPFPDYDGFEFDKQLSRKYSGKSTVSGIEMTIVTSRSCPYNCTFCFHPSGKKYRRRSLDSVFKELDWLLSKYSFGRLFICDELFGNDIKYVKNFCERIQSYKLNYWIQIRVDCVDDDVVEMLVLSGCDEIAFGVEHVNAEILSSMKKRVTAAQIEKAFDIVLKHGIKPVGSIIFGDVAETKETIYEALQWWSDHYNYNINLSWMLVFPGSEVYKEACRRGLILDPVKYLQDGCPMLNISNISDADLLKMRSVVAGTLMLGKFQKSNEEINKLTVKLNHLITDKKVGIWPALGDNIAFFEDNCPQFCHSSNVYYINRNPNAHWLNINENIKQVIYEPGIIGIKNIDIILCTRVELLEEIKQICKSEYPSVKAVLTLREFVDTDSYD